MLVKDPTIFISNSCLRNQQIILLLTEFGKVEYDIAPIILSLYREFGLAGLLKYNG